MIYDLYIVYWLRGFIKGLDKLFKCRINCRFCLLMNISAYCIKCSRTQHSDSARPEAKISDASIPSITLYHLDHHAPLNNMKLMKFLNWIRVTH